MNKELEALLLNAARATEMGVVGVDVKRAQEFNVPVGRLVRAGDSIPGHSKKAMVTGYYCPYPPYSAWRPPSRKCLSLDALSPGDGRTGYTLVVLDEDSTGEAGFGGDHMRLSLAEMKAYLRGVAAGAYTAYTTKPRR